MRVKLLAAFSSLVALACAPAPPTATRTPAPGSASNPTALAPFPYTAEQIQSACPAGHTIVFRVEASGKGPVRRALHFASSSADGAEIETSMVDDAGRPLEAPTRARARWDELRAHASFPQAKTTIGQETIETPAGSFACSVYTVRGDGDEVKRFYFAKEMPGAPVLFTTERGGARVLTSTLVAVDAGGDVAPPRVPLARLDAEAARMPQIAAMAKIARAFSPAFSPDGKRVAYVGDASGVPQVWIAGTEGGMPARVTSFDDPVTRVVWSPDGAWLAALVAPGGGMNAQIWLMHPDGSAQRRITAGGKDNSFLDGFTHDGARLAFSSNVRDPKTTDAYLYDVAKGEATRIADNEGIGGVMDVSRDGKQAILLRMRARGNVDLYVVDAHGAGGEVHLTPHEGPASAPAALFAPDGRVIYLATNLGRDRVAFMRAAFDGKRAGPLEILAARDDAELEGLEIDEAGALAALVWNVAGRSEMELFDLKKRAVIAKPESKVDVLLYPRFSRDGTRIAIAGSGARSPLDVYLTDRKGAPLARLTDSPHPGVDLDALVRPELVRYAGKDGLPLTAWLYRPAGASAPGPLVLSFHGGPEGQERPVISATYQALLARGIGVLAPNVRGSSGFGKKFVNLDNGPLRKAGVEDIRATVEYAVASGVADPKRIGIMGGSYGGYMVMAGLTEYPDLFAAGVDLFGVVNFETFFAKSEPWMRAISRAEYGDPETQKDLLRELSPIHKLARVRAPTLVLHGANDTNVPVVEAEQVVHGLLARGVPVEYVLFPDEGHGFRKEANRTRSVTATVRWFERYLAGEKRP